RVFRCLSITGVFHTWAVSDFQEPSRRVVPEGLPAPVVSERPPPNLVPASSPSLRRIREFGNSARCHPEERRLRTWFVDLFHSFAAMAGRPDAKAMCIVTGILPSWNRELHFFRQKGLAPGKRTSEFSSVFRSSCLSVTKSRREAQPR